MIRRITLVVALLLAGTSLATSEQPVRTEKELKFLERIRSHEEKVIFSRTDEELLSLGKYTCLLLDDKITPSKIVEYVVVSGNLEDEPSAMGYIISDAVLTLCRKYEKLLEVG